MMRISIGTLFVFGAMAACSGYEGGGDIRIVPLADAGAPTGDASSSPGEDSSTPREGGTDAQQPKGSTVVAYYAFDGTADDKSPAMRHLDLVVTGGATFTTGQYSQAITIPNFGCAASRPMVDDAFAFGSNDFTVQAWISPTGNVGVGLGTRQFGLPATEGWLLYADRLSVVFQSNGPGLTAGSGASSGFRHIAARRKSGALALFVNGKKVAERASYPAIGPEQPFCVLRSNGTLDGTPRIDEVVIWSRALEDNAILDNYVRGNSAMPPLLTE